MILNGETVGRNKYINIKKMSLCSSQLNLTMIHVTKALYELNHKGNLGCYPTFSHEQLSDMLIHTRDLIFKIIELHHTWVGYKTGEK